MPGSILITGTSRGLGRALAEHYLGRGWRVFGCSRSEEGPGHPGYRHFRADVASAEAVGEMFFALRQETRSLDALVNNAGIASMNAFALTPEASMRRIFDVNVQGTALCCQKALGLLRKARHPRILNLTTVAVPLRLEGEALYAASKGAVETLTRVLAKEYGSYGITCNALGPSPIDTDLIRGVPADRLEALVGRQAIRRKATAADVINLADFFLRPESDMISGQVVYLGGVS